MALGEFIKKIREERGLTQEELAALSGLERGWISQLELDNIKEPSAKKLLKLSKPLRVKLDDIYKAAGYVKESKTEYKASRTPDDLMSELMVSMPVAIPVVASVHAGPSEALDYAYWARTKEAKNLKALLVKGYCMSPQIEEGDIIIIDPELSPSEGRILVCYNDGEIFLEKYGEHHSCSHIYGVIIGVNRRM